MILRTILFIVIVGSILAFIVLSLFGSVPCAPGKPGFADDGTTMVWLPR